MERKIGIEETFLREFTETIIHSYTERKGIKSKSGEQLLEENPQVVAVINSQFSQRQQAPPDGMRKIKPFQRQMLIETGTQMPQQPHPPRNKRPSGHPVMPRIPLVRPKHGNVDLGRLNYLVGDPWIQTIECQGPEKNVTVKKGSKILTTAIRLNEEEIKNIINSFSQRTKIPINEGLLKALDNNLMMTAAVSEIIGSRFIIQKVNPERLFTQNYQN